MKREDLDKIAKNYFDSNKSLGAIFATESGHFFYEKVDRDTFIKKSTKDEKAVNYTKDYFTPGQKTAEEITKAVTSGAEVFSFDECPAGNILKKRGFKSVQEIKAADLSKVQGLGEKKAEEIREYLKNFD